MATKKKFSPALSPIEKIYQQYDLLTESNRKLADFIIENPELATFKSLNELKSLTGISDATIIRFAYELGYGSFKELREDLADYIRKIIYTQKPETRKVDSGETSIESVVDADINYIKRTMDGVDRNRFAILVDKVVKARTIWVMGARISAFVAEFLAFQLTRLGYRAWPIARGRRSLLEQALDIEADDLVIVFDQIIYSPDVYDAVEFLAGNTRKVTISTLTSDPLAQIVQHSDLSFFLDLSGQKDFSLISLSAPMAFVNALIESVYAKDPEKAGKKIRSYEDNVLSRASYAMSITVKRKRNKRYATKKEEKQVLP